MVEIISPEGAAPAPDEIDVTSIEPPTFTPSDAPVAEDEDMEKVAAKEAPATPEPKPQPEKAAKVPVVDDDLVDEDPVAPDRDIDDIITDASGLAGLKGDPRALASVDWDRVEVKTTDGVKETIGWKNGDRHVIKAEPLTPKEAVIEQVIEGDVSYDVETRPDGSRHLLGRTGEDHGGTSVMLTPPDIPGAVPAEEPDEEPEPEVQDPPTRGPDEPRGLTRGRLRPTGELIMSTGREVFLDENGREMSEQQITITDDRINDGQPTNIPTIYDGVALGQEDAIQAAMASGQTFPSHRSIADAEEASRKHSRQVQRERDFTDAVRPSVLAFAETARAILSGTNAFVTEMTSVAPFLGDAAEFMERMVPLGGFQFQEPQSGAGKLLAGVTQAGVAAFTFSRPFTFLSPFWKWTLAGGITDFAAFAPEDEGLIGPFIESMGQQDSEVLEAARQILLDGLLKNQDENEITRRLKGMREGALIGLTLDGMVAGYSVLRKLKLPGRLGTIGKTIATMAATTLALTLASDTAEAGAAKKILDGLSAAGFKPAEPFFAVLTKRLEESKQGSATGEQWLKMIENMKQKGVKDEERHWTGVDDFLEENKFNKITRFELIDYLKEHKVEITDVTLGPEFLPDPRLRPQRAVAGRVGGPIPLENAEAAVRNQMANDVATIEGQIDGQLMFPVEGVPLQLRTDGANFDLQDLHTHAFPEDVIVAFQRISRAISGEPITNDLEFDILQDMITRGRTLTTEQRDRLAHLDANQPEPIILGQRGQPLEPTPGEQGVLAAMEEDLERIRDAGHFESIEAEGFTPVLDPNGQGLLFQSADLEPPFTLLDFFQFDPPADPATIEAAFEATAKFRGIIAEPPGPILNDLDILSQEQIEVIWEGGADMFSPGPGARMPLEAIRGSGELSEAAEEAAIRLDRNRQLAVALQGGPIIDGPRAAGVPAPPVGFRNLTEADIDNIRRANADDVHTLDQVGLRFEPPLEGNNDNIFTGFNEHGNSTDTFTLDELRADLDLADDVIEAAERLDNIHTEAVTIDGPTAQAALTGDAFFQRILADHPETLNTLDQAGVRVVVDGVDNVLSFVPRHTPEERLSFDEILERFPAYRAELTTVQNKFDRIRTEELEAALPGRELDIPDLDRQALEGRLEDLDVEVFLDPSGEIMARDMSFAREDGGAGHVTTLEDYAARAQGEERMLAEALIRFDEGIPTPGQATQLALPAPAINATQILTTDQLRLGYPQTVQRIEDQGFDISLDQNGNLTVSNTNIGQINFNAERVREAAIDGEVSQELATAVSQLDDAIRSRQAAADINQITALPDLTDGDAIYTHLVNNHQPAHITLDRHGFGLTVEPDGHMIGIFEHDVGDIIPIEDIVNNAEDFVPDVRNAAFAFQQGFDRLRGMGTLPEIPQTFRRTQHSSEVLAGGDNYREILITLPRNRQAQWQVFQTGDNPGVVQNFGSRKAAQDFVDGSANKANLQVSERQSVTTEPYTGGHFDDENILVHMRLTERVDNEGKKVLFIEELQSDWFQAAGKLRKREVERVAEQNGITKKEANKLVPRHFGFMTGDASANVMDAMRVNLKSVTELRDFKDRMNEALQASGRLVSFNAEEARHAYINADLGAPPTGRFGDVSDLLGGTQPRTAVEEAYAIQNHFSRLEDAVSMTERRLAHIRAVDNGKYPDAPFKDTWHELAMRRVARFAAENDFDRIAWTTGAQQVQRYRSALRKQVDEIVWTKTEGGIKIVGKMDGNVRVDTDLGETELSDAIGKAMSEQIIGDPSQTGRITGDNITFDEPGMARFYDKKMRDYASKFGKKFKSKVGETVIPTRSSMQLNHVDQETLSAAAERAHTAGDVEAAEAIERVATNFRANMRSRNAYDPMTEDQLDEWLPEAIEEGTRETVHSMDVTDSMRETALSEGFPLFNLAAGATGATAAAAAATGGAPREAEAKSTAGQGQPLPGPDDVDLGGGSGNDQVTDGGEFQVAGAAKEVIGSGKQLLEEIFPEVPIHPKLKTAANRLKRRLKGGLPPIPIDKAITTERELLRVNRTAGGKELGSFKNEHRVLKAPKGSGLPDIAIGGQTTQQWLDKVQKVLSPDEIKQAMTWYDDVAGLFNDKFGVEEGPIRMIAWLVANQNTKPAVAMMNSLRTVENMVAGIGIDEGLKGGLTEETLRTFLSGGKVKKGVGQKIYDFIDSALGRQTRTFYGDAVGAGAPAVADIWTLFDSGAIDKVRFGDLEELGYDMTGVKMDYKTETTSPSQNQYEHSADWVRNLTEELNGLGFGQDIGAGGPLEARQVQAIGWMAMTKMLRGRGQTAADALEQSSYRMAVKAAPAVGSEWGKRWTDRMAVLPGASRTKINRDVTRKSVEIVSEALKVDIRGMYHADGGWTDEGVVKVNPATVVELISSPEKANAVADGLALLGDQKEIWVSRIKGLTKNPKGAEIDIVEVGSHHMSNQETYTKVWKAIEDADPTDLIGGFQPHLRPDGSVGMTILVNKGGENVKRIIDGDVKKILEKALKKFDFDLDIEVNEAGINVRRNDYEEEGFENGQGHLERLAGAGSGQAGERIVSRRGELADTFEASVAREEAIAVRHAAAFDGAGGPNQGQVGLRIQNKLLREEVRRGEIQPDDPRLEPGEFEAIQKELGIGAAAATIRGVDGAEASEGEGDPEVASLTPGDDSGAGTGFQIPENTDPRLAGFWGALKRNFIDKPLSGKAGREGMRNEPKSFEDRMVEQPPDPGAVEALERQWDEYREVDRDLFGDPVRTEGIDFNTGRMNTNDDVIQQINNVSRIYAEQIKGTTGGVVPLKVTRQVADLIGADPEVAAKAIKGLPSDTSDLHVRALVMRDMLVEAAQDIDRRALAINTAPDQASSAELLAFREAFARFATLQQQMKGVQTDIARALSAFRIPAEDADNVMRRAQITQEALAVHGGPEATLDLANRWLKTPVDKKGDLGPGAFRKTINSIFEVWINGLLSSVRTHEVNFVGNNLFQLWQLPERAVAGVIGGARQLLPNSNPDRVFIGESVALLHGWLEGIPSGFRLGWETFKTEQPSRGLGKMETSGQRAISAQEWGTDPSSWWGRGIDLMGAAVRLPGRFLMSADEFNRATGHASQRRSLAYRQAQTIMDGGGTTKKAAEAYADVMGGKIPEVEQSITDFGDMVTFTKSMGSMGKKWQDVIASTPIGRVIVPFFRTPANIFKEFLSRVPIANFAMKEVREDFIAGGARRDLAISKVTTGTSAMALGAYLTSQGIVTGGGPTDPRMRATWLRGHQPYSIKFPGSDEWVPYGRLEPLGLLMGVAADFMEYRQWAPADIPSEDEDLLLTRAIASVIHTVSQKTFLMGIAELSAAYHDPDRYAQTFMARLAGSAIPYSSMLRDIETAVDRPRRDTRVDPNADPVRKQFDAALNSMKERTPGWSEDLPARLNFWGEEIKAFEGEWYQAFNAFRPRKIKESPIDDELLRLSFPLTKPRAEIGGVKLDPQQAHDFIKAYNEVTVNNPVTETDMTLREGLNWLVTKSGFYKVAISDEQRMDMIREIRDAHVGKAREAMVTPGTKFFDADLREKAR